ncbi:MAG: hypothetical protein J7623_27430 [Chitinophaga sp.]|uniref:hypothetical protein n=1 Tax=Chitinophaga sp. TaxID=1869181 RepID=UPI001B17DBA0|nr:hypothetical protein [Chitinophaga sp.]MBO9732404.1 hypothetical protein [Chitinophaga sp.]
MQSISLIGYTFDKGVITYYTKIQQLNDKELECYIPCQITPYSVLLQEDDDENTRHLVDGFFHVVTNNPNAIVLCDFYLEFLWEHIPFPGPATIKKFESLLKALAIYGNLKWLVLCLSITKNIKILLDLLTKNSIPFAILSETDRLELKKNLRINNDFELKEFQEQYVIFFNILSNLSKLGINGIIVDSEVLYLYIQRVNINIPIIYTTDAHVKEVVNFIHNKQK